MKGVELSRRLYFDAVRPLLDRPHTAALIGPGSEVLGFDTDRSTDHDWGPRLQLFLTADDLATHGTAIHEMLADRLPHRIAGYPISLVAVGEHGTRHMRESTGRVEHAVAVAELGAWLNGLIGVNPLEGMTTRDWLGTPAQRLAEVTGGAVFHDDLGELSRVRRTLAWYPDDVWRHVLACQWQRIGQEDAFVGRCGETGDELGSTVVAARVVRDLMRLCLLLHRRYPPYSKWLGTAFARLPGIGALHATLSAVLSAGHWQDRQNHLVYAYETVAELHNRGGLTVPLDPRTRPFHNRPFQVLEVGRFVAALRAGITDPAVRALPLTGAVDQFADSTDVLSHGTRPHLLTAALYEGP
ncbi:DUF4037 domain-containing protein [Actinoplanes sp. TBRC 11911]|uniref:DUF4037 domain-containing protein n=1 Tax=Actinoplanes sp. TBRC 11911 TaxID=2729386 RepID=UPI002896B12E|nr:DUF4037 domain-containing protein [Actinoplanes sp. TBRC 11911]